jgi:hypothetical protein
LVLVDNKARLETHQGKTVTLRITSHIVAKVPVRHPLGDHTQLGEFHGNSKKWDNIPMRESLPEHGLFTEVLMGIIKFFQFS